MNLIKIRKYGLLVYLFCFYALAATAWVGLKWYLGKNYSVSKRENLISGASRRIDTKQNPCQNQIRGEPVDSGNEYVKIHFDCRERAADNTLSLKPVSDRSFKNIIMILAGVNRFAADDFIGPEKKYDCSRDGAAVGENDQIYNKNQINCHEN